MCQHLCYHKLISAVQNPKHVCSESYPCVLLLVVAVAVAVAVAVVVAVVVVVVVVLKNFTHTQTSYGTPPCSVLIHK